ncbi:hypothetical protein [Chitinophaga vietnamensis]|uniref:hypothetical protein n=1 Tax=Chitinophaga vietnamensis TaxID=2593957 RepID=UPI0011785FF0|nr:hypothetical protein [Chitinophaga vietnamensis]
MRFFFLLLLLTYSGITFGQNIHTIENDLLQNFQQIQYWGDHKETDAGDSILLANKRFEQKLLQYTSNNPATISADFAPLDAKGLQIVTSKDKHLRIYSWDTEMGGTMRFFSNVYQYQSDGKVFSLNPHANDDKLHAAAAYVAIYTLENQGKTYYLGVYNAVYSNKDAYQGIKVFAISNNQLSDSVRLIKTKTGIKNQLSFAYDFFSVVDRKERPIHLITFDPDTQTISLPVVKPDGTVTEKYIQYKFTGEYFERVIPGQQLSPVKTGS